MDFGKILYDLILHFKDFIMLRTYMTIQPIVNGVAQKSTFSDQKVYPFQDKESANQLIAYFKQSNQNTFLIDLDKLNPENPNEPYKGIIKNLDCQLSNINLDLVIQFDKQYHLPQNNGYIVGVIEHKKSNYLALHDMAGLIYDFNLNV